jgi:hypothetical protein
VRGVGRRCWDRVAAKGEATSKHPRRNGSFGDVAQRILRRPGVELDPPLVLQSKEEDVRRREGGAGAGELDVDAAAGVSDFNEPLLDGVWEPRMRTRIGCSTRRGTGGTASAATAAKARTPAAIQVAT